MSELSQMFKKMAAELQELTNTCTALADTVDIVPVTTFPELIDKFIEEQQLRFKNIDQVMTDFFATLPKKDDQK